MQSVPLSDRYAFGDTLNSKTKFDSCKDSDLVYIISSMSLVTTFSFHMSYFVYTKIPLSSNLHLSHFNELKVVSVSLGVI